MGTQKLWDGTLSPDEFCIAAKALCEKWKHIDSTLPQWNWVPRKGRMNGATCKVEGYLSLENVYRTGPDEDHVSELRLSEEEEESTDSATLVLSPKQEKYGYNYHIVYSFSYRVPVLYFRGYRCDGQILTFEEIQNDLPDSSTSLLKESKWTFMTQEEHPFLCCPWFTLHPCGTSDWMKLLIGGNQQLDCKLVHYLPAWLSVVSQAVGLRVPLSLYNGSSIDWKLDGSSYQA